MAYNQQPQAHMGMSVASGGSRNAKNVPYDSKGERDWSNGICGCSGDCGTFCVGFWCPCIVYSQNKSRVEHLEKQGFPHPDGGSSCGGDCFLHCCLTGCLGVGWILQISSRANVRNRYKVAGGCFGDCCLSFWCNPCALTQESQEIELEEESMLPAGQKH